MITKVGIRIAGILFVAGYLVSAQSPPVVASVANAAGFQSVIAENTWISVFGKNLSSTTRTWQADDFVNGSLPRQLDGVRVTVAGQAAYVYFISPAQINALVPVETLTGPVQVQTANGNLISNVLSAQMQTLSPAFFTYSNTRIAATHADGSPVGPDTLFPGKSTPAKPGETIVLYGTGFGPTAPSIPDGLIVTTPSVLTAGPKISIGGVDAPVSFAGLVQAGLYQFNVTVPASMRAGDIAVIAQSPGFSTPNTLLTVQ